MKNVGSLIRHWHFDQTSMTISDSVEGCQNHKLSRFLITPLDVIQRSDCINIRAANIEFSLSVNGQISLEHITRWTAYGCGVPATAIRITSNVTLPWTGILSLRVL